MESPEFKFIEHLCNQHLFNENQPPNKPYSNKLKKFYEEFKKFSAKNNFTDYCGKEEKDLTPFETWWYKYFQNELFNGHAQPPFKLIDDDKNSDSENGFMAFKDDVRDSFQKINTQDSETSLFITCQKYFALDKSVKNKRIQQKSVFVFLDKEKQKEKWLQLKPDWKFSVLHFLEGFSLFSTAFKTFGPLRQNGGIYIEINLNQCFEIISNLKSDAIKENHLRETEESKIVEVNTDSNKVGYIYLIRERERIRLNENVYKIGRTEQERNLTITRFNGYKPESEIILLYQCETKLLCPVEKEIKDTFKKRFKLTEGKEYFEGDPILMKRLIINILQKYE